MGLSAVLDTAIGLTFVFFMLSLVCAAINELIASAFNWRAKNLALALQNYFQDEQSVRGFYDEPRIKVLRRPGKGRLPSYIPAGVFAEAALDFLFVPPAGQEGRPIQVTRDMVNNIQYRPAKDLLLSALRHGEEDVTVIRARLEQSFNELMERASGWYKRRVQACLLLVGLVVTAGLNADALAITQHLATNETVRAAVVAQAGQALRDAPTEADTAPPDPFSSAARHVDAIQELKLPLGWGRANHPVGWGWLFKAAGIALTAIAVTLGAPFWFDLLGKLSQLRGVGQREGTGKGGEP